MDRPKYQTVLAARLWVNFVPKHEAQEAGEAIACDFTRSGYCAIQIGTFTTNDKLTCKLNTKALKNKNWKMSLEGL